MEELIKIEGNLPEVLKTNTFIAVDVESIFDHKVKRLVGTVIQVWPHSFDLEYANSLDHVSIDFSVVKQAYWAPMGYRP